MPSGKTRIAIIGGGVAGLIVLRHAVSRSEIYSVSLFEQSDQIGGTWVYTDETDFGKNGLPIHSSMYKNLKTNLPKEIMQIPDFPFKNKEGPSFVHHSVIREYLREYADHFNLHPRIKLNTLVNRIEPNKLPHGQVIWLVTTQDLLTRKITIQIFDAVVLCNGHHSIGRIPKLPGIANFPGTCVHSHQYRIPEIYKDRKVCILGASWSGIDITLEVCKYAKKIYLSHDLPEPIDSKMAKNVEQRAGIDYVDGSKFVFRDGTTAQIDDLIYCTGYEYTYPFLSSKVQLQTQDNHVEPIYKHMIHMDYPSLFFMGLPLIVIPFPMFNLQAQYILKVIEGSVKLPSPQRMREEYEAEKKSLTDQGVLLRHINKLGDRQWSYYEEIAAGAECEVFLPVVRKIYNHVNDMREKDFTTYKNYEYRIINDEEFSFTYCKSSQ